MGSLFRSEEMALCQLFLQSEAAYTCVSELGELGLAQFRDLNPDVNAFQRKFVHEVRRCDEMERKLRFLEKEIKKDEIPILDTGDDPDAPPPKEMIDLEATFEKAENDMKELNSNTEVLKKNYLELTELRHILRKTQVFFDGGEIAELHRLTQIPTSGMQEETVNLLGDEGLRAGNQALKLGFVAGVIPREKAAVFERMLWRVCRGNVYLKQADIEESLEDPMTGNKVNKSVFVIFFQGEQLKTKVKKICEGFHATLYPCPETPAERREMAMGVMTRIEDLNIILQQTQDHRHRVLVAAAKDIKDWVIKVRKIKAIYHTLNLFNLDVTRKCLIAECWVAVSDLDKIQLALRRGTEQTGSSVPSILNRMDTKTSPPTYNRTNKFTATFQGIVDAYGAANYREINPAPFTIITFPFLFAVMFGDAGHGTLMFLFALWMVIKEKSIEAQKLGDGIFNTFFTGRYIILLMGLFSIYTGFIYNDIFSKSVNIFGSSWHVQGWNEGPFKDGYPAMVQLNPATAYSGSPYPFGVDPVWQAALNKILFLNSYKMKLSVIFGISQMLFGIILSFLNNRYFKRPLNIFCEFIPQMLFMLSIFGYLIGLIFWKWLSVTSADSSCAPSLLVTLINMILFTPPNDKPGTVCTLHPIFSGQNSVQVALLAVAGICVPWMLLVKPIIQLVRHKQKVKGQARADNIEYSSQEEVVHFESAGLVDHGEEEEEEEFSFGDIFVHQALHTIEYCLETISYTASYLRLWALSLAHAQLSEVLWTMVMKMAFGMSNFWIGGIVVYFIFAGWAFLTIGILLVMEGLSAFLHALRLHWVEFQSKFYSGDGYMFVPFSFKVILAEAEAEEL